MMSSNEIRKRFFDFFNSKGHTIVPSAPIVIKNDPSLLFTNAGMNQFKDYFLGNNPAPYSRAADTQKCLRVSGKHNDLEEVGVDTYHHTMFEMLGNWSFGNSDALPKPYFKEEAIAYGWELLTKVYGIPADTLYVTIFEGDEKEGLEMDGESYDFWKKWIPEDRILKGNKKDNFWEMGDTGPCGPCTEIHVDCRSVEEKNAVPGKDRVNQDDPQVIEIWNIVFIQYNRRKDTTLEPLPARHVDTGMGFERLVRVLQNKKSNYDTDVFSGTIREIEEISGRHYGFSDSRQDISFRVIADHIRAIAFPITDGQLPSNTGAGYVIRRILRRAVRYYFSYLDVKQPLLYKLVPVIAAQFRDVFPGLDQQKEFVARVILEEENNFLRTLDTGLKRLDLLLKQSSMIDGKTAFELYDTYGFPIDLTRLIASENGLQVDEPGFEKEMKQQKDRSRAAAAVDTGDWIVIDGDGTPGFVGYELEEADARVIKYRSTKSQGKEFFQLVLDQTPFYAESGGQVGDTGVLLFGNEEIPVINTKKENDLVIHFTERLPENIVAPVIARIDAAKRAQIRAHHTATHLMHAALRQVLGTHVVQKGSLVNEAALRFDFSHFAKVSEEELRRVESVVNEKIRENIPVVIREMDKEDAIASGAMALFGEKYGNKVRVVTIDPRYSVELCGGTHVGSTGELGIFKFIHETAVGAGVRRVEAVSGRAAGIYINSETDLLTSVREQLKNPKDLLKAVNSLQSDYADLKKQLEKLEAKHLVSIKNSLLDKITVINGSRFIGESVDAGSMDSFRKLSALLKNEVDMAILVADIDGKAAVSVILSDEFAGAKKLEAPAIIRELVAPLIKGGGGGQKTLATAGGQDVTKFQEVFAEVKGLLQ